MDKQVRIHLQANAVIADDGPYIKIDDLLAFLIQVQSFNQFLKISDLTKHLSDYRENVLKQTPALN